MRVASIKLRLLLGLSFVSSATVCLEVTLTRYFSISQDYHFAFLVISMAFLGFGASGSFLFLFENLKNKNPDIFLTLSSLAFSLTILASFIIANSFPFDFAKLTWDKNQLFFIFLYYLILSLPFFFAGMTISFATTQFSKFIHKIYFFDLLGAGTGSFLAALIFLPKGEKGVFLFLSILALVASILFCPAKSLLLRALLFFLIATEAVFVISRPSWLSFRISPFKALPLALKYPRAELRLTKWNTLSRVDILHSPAVRYAPGLSLIYEENLPDQFGLSLDGGELNAITCFNSLQEKRLEFLSYLPSSLAYSFVQTPRTLVIEPRGGLDVLAARYFHSQQIKIIESNPLIIHLMSHDLAPLSGNLYQQKNVHVVSAHPREALSKEKELYDLIIFSLTDVFGASSSGLYGFHENYLYTVEAFTQVLSRLSPQGVISMTLYLLPPPRQELKALASWVEALERAHKDPASCLAVVQTWGTISFFIKKNPFEKNDTEKLKNFARERLFDLVYYPGISRNEVNIYNVSPEPIYYNLTSEILSPQRRKELYRNYLFEIKPPTDNRPFFANVYKLGKIKKTYKALGGKWLPLLQGGLLIPLLFFQATLVALVFILWPVLAYSKKKREKKLFSFRIGSYFTLIGAGFMFIEITLIQKFILFLGHPLYSISTVIFSILLSSGLGSFFSRRILGKKYEKKIKRVLLAIFFLIPLYFVILPFLNRAFIGLGLPGKVFLTFMTIFPLGFLMGFPFPTGIRLLTVQKERLIPWAWATNSFSSVVNSVLAGWMALWAGYNLMLILAAVCYLLANSLLNFSGYQDEAQA